MPYSISIKIANKGPRIKKLTGSLKKEASLVLTFAPSQEVQSSWEGGSRDEFRLVNVAGSTRPVNAAVNPMTWRREQGLPTVVFEPGWFLWAGGTFLGKPSSVSLTTNDPVTVLQLLDAIGDGGETGTIRKQFDAAMRKETGVGLIEYASLIAGIGIAQTLEMLKTQPEMLKAEATRYAAASEEIKPPEDF